MSTEPTFNTNANHTIARKLLVAYLNTGTEESPVWSPIGKRVEDSTAEYDWGMESKKDILGNTYTTMKDPTITQSFDPWNLVNGDAAQNLVWKYAIYEHNAQALSSMDMLIAHLYAGTKNTAVFAERYSSCAVEVTSLGGEGGGNIAMPVSVTYGGTRTVGKAAVAANGSVTFTPDAAA